MTSIELIDYKGDFWELGIPGPFVTKCGFTEMWVYVIRGPVVILKDYQQIPLPLFTEWWPS